jgi:hypothetical protein
MNPIGNPARMQSLLLANALAGKGYSPDTSKAILATPGMPKGASALQASPVPMQQEAMAPQGMPPEQEPQAPAGPQYDQDIARALMAPDFSPAPTSFSALARVLGSGIGTYQNTKNRQAESANADYERQMFARTLAGLPPELQAYGKVDPKGALGMQAEAAMRPPAKVAEPPLPPTNVREYEYAKAQGFQGTFEQWQQQQRAPGTQVTTNVNNPGQKYGPIPAGYMLQEGPEGARLVAIPGGGPAAEAEARAAQQQAATQQQSMQGGVVTQDIDRALSLISGDTFLPTTGYGALLSAIPGSPQRDLAGLLDTIKANVGFDKLQQMRAASPTGGALGNVTERENALLQSVLGNLEQSQSKEQLVYNLRRVRDVFNIVVHGTLDTPKATEPGGQGGGEPAQKAIDAFGTYEPDKYEYGVNPATGKFARRPKQ